MTDEEAVEVEAPPEAPENEEAGTREESIRTTSAMSISSSQRKKKVKQVPLKETPRQPFPQIPIWIKDWTATLIVGTFVVSHWRGLWTLFDLWTCDQPSTATGLNGENFCFAGTYGNDEKDAQTRLDAGIFSYWLGAIFTAVGVAMIWMGLWTPMCDKVSWKRAVLRFLIVYILGLAALNQWRGVWYVTDELIWKDRPLESNWLTTCCGAGGAFLLLSGGSLLAPPASFLVDGPGLHQPPIGVTIMSSYYSLTLEATEKPPHKNVLVLMVDALVSFFGLPILVVWFWRGCWQLQDWYFWGLTANQHDLLISLGWSFLMGIVCATVASEPIMHFLPEVNKTQQWHITMIVVGRLRTLVLAFGAVAFWRVVWNLWDLGGTTNASVWSSEVVSVFSLTAMGCCSCITAPPSTLGVDVTPNPKCADEPLFAMLPIPWEILFWWGIGRNPCVEQLEPEPSEVELSEMQPEKTKTIILLTLESVRSWRPGLVREEGFYIKMSTRYFECQKPGMEDRQCTEYCQNRPGLHQRKRSQFFRNR